MLGKVITRISGFYLLEVLITVLVLSIGMLGVAGLQLLSKRSNYDAVQRSTAAALAQDIVERMRTNTSNLGSYTNDGAGLMLTENTVGAVDCTNDCTPIQVIQYDLYELQQSLAGVTEQRQGGNVSGLAFPIACITGPDGGSGNYTVAIAWRGLTKLSNPLSNVCGQGSGLYDSESELDIYRRVLVVDTYIHDPV